MSLSRRNPRRDQNEASIVADLRKAGVEVWRLSGTGLPDVLLRFRGTFFAGEIKSATGRLTSHQGAFPVWRTLDDVFFTLGLKRTVY